jgi:hypothetical protein
MKINLDEPIRTLDGEPVQEGGKQVLAKDILVGACLTPLDSDRQQPGQAYRLYTLAHQLNPGGAVDLDASDIAFLQQRVEALGFPPLTVGQITDLLNGRARFGGRTRMPSAA